MKCPICKKEMEKSSYKVISGERKIWGCECGFALPRDDESEAQTID